MRISILAFVTLLVPFNPVAAQPQDGDLVLSMIGGGQRADAFTVYFSPRPFGSLTTLHITRGLANWHNWVRMAPGNQNVVLADVDNAQTSSRLIRVDPTGRASTLATLPNGVTGFELDGDGRWIVTAVTRSAGLATHVHGVHDALGTVTTIFASPRGAALNEISILRERNIDYALANAAGGTGSVPRVFGADRTGVTTTIVATPGNPLARITGIELDPRTGTFITTDLDGPTSSPPELQGAEVNRVSVTGRVATLVSFPLASGARVNQDDTVWVTGATSSPVVAALMKFDLSRNAVITIIPLPYQPHQAMATAVEVYGGRPLTCTRLTPSGRTIRIDLLTQRLIPAGATYQLACSFGRRPGLLFSNGDWLHLAPDLMFFLSAFNLLPTVFVNFAGTIQSGQPVVAAVLLPLGLPANLGVTVFCAGVIMHGGGVLQTTNTHWFEW